MGQRGSPDAEAERRMEKGRLLLRRLRSVPPGQRVSLFCEEYRANAIFLIRFGDELSGDVRVRLDAMQGRIERVVRAIPSDRRADLARKLALRAWRNLSAHNAMPNVEDVDPQDETKPDDQAA